MANKSKVPITATQRLKQDYMRLKKDPVPYVTAEPTPSNILEWYYVVRGPEDTPYVNGYYHGKLVFPREFPFRPPAIYMITPSGRFKTNTRLCLSISDFHPDTWNPAWSVTTILTGLLSFMVEDTPTLGSLETSNHIKQQFAASSLAFNVENPTFCDLFPEIADAINEKLAKARESKRAGKKVPHTKVTEPKSSALLPTPQNDPDNENRGFANLVILAGVAVFGIVVNNILKTL